MNSAAKSLLGRNAEFALLERFLTEARAGGDLLLTGDPGTGLTALLKVAAVSGADHGYQVVHADPADPVRRSVPLSGLSRVLRPLAAARPAILAQDAQVLQAVLDLENHPNTGQGKVPRDAPADPIRVAVVLLSRLRAAPGVSLLMIVDDADWLDTASFDVLRFVSDRLPGTGTAVLTAAHRQFGEGVAGRASGHPVPPLGEETARALLRRRFPDLSGSVLERVLTVAAGNPLALHELPAALTVGERAGSSSYPLGPPLTDRLRAAWAPRVMGLPDATRRLLLLAALDDVGSLERLGRLDADTSLAVLETAETAGVVHVTTGGVLAFRHPLLRAVVVDLASRHERRQAHLSWAAVLSDEPETRSRHLGQAHVHPDEDIARQLEQTARRERVKGDFDAATAGLVRAGELSPTGEQRGRRLADAAYLAARSGRPMAAAELLSQAQNADSRIGGSLRAALVTSLGLLLRDGLPAAHQHLTDALAEHPTRADPDDETLIAALRLLGLLSTLGADTQAWQRTQQAFVRFRTVTPVGPATMAVVARALGHPSGLAAIDEEIAQQQRNPSWCQAISTAHVAMMLNRIEDGQSSLRAFQPAPFAVDARDVQTLFLLAHGYLASGEWQAAEEVLTTPGLGDWFRTSGSGGGVSPLGVLEAYLAALRGDGDRAMRLAEEAENWAGPRRIALVTWTVAQVRALTATARGDFEEAYQHLSVIVRPGTLGVAVGLPVYVVLDLVEAAVRTDRQDEAKVRVALLHEAGVSDLSPVQRLLLTAARALVAATPAESEKLFEEALADSGAEGRPFERARVQLLFGEQQRRVHQRQQARSLLATAHDTFIGLGARPWADRAGEELRAAGSGTPTDPFRHRQQDRLNPQERSIAELAAAGLSNKEIGTHILLSPRTVGNVLHRIYRRLAITSRAGLGDALADLGQDD